MRRAMARFPIPEVAEARWSAISSRRVRRRASPTLGSRCTRSPSSLRPRAVHDAGGFVEVHLAKEGHDGTVGINLLTKIQMPNLAPLYGAMLAGVDYVLMGAGIPREIPAVLDALASHQPAQLRLDLEDAAPAQAEYLRFDPAVHGRGPRPPLRPRVPRHRGSNMLATMLGKKAPARGRLRRRGSHGRRTQRAASRSSGLAETRRAALRRARRRRPRAGSRAGPPFWVAGGAGSPGRLRRRCEAGAAGIQVGTLFAYCDESGISESLRRSVLESVVRGAVRIRTDGRASPTGFPFKVVAWDGDPAAGVSRKRVCDLGYLRNAYRRGDGTIGYRCASEPEDQFVAKGGAPEETPDRKCLCNGLLSTIGLGQRRDAGVVEPPLITSGDDVAKLAGFLGGRTRYSAADAVRWLLGGAAA